MTHSAQGHAAAPGRPTFERGGWRQPETAVERTLRPFVFAGAAVGALALILTQAGFATGLSSLFSAQAQQRPVVAAVETSPPACLDCRPAPPPFRMLPSDLQAPGITKMEGRMPPSEAKLRGTVR